MNDESQLEPYTRPPLRRISNNESLIQALRQLHHALQCEDPSDRAALASGALELFPNCSLEAVTLFERLTETELQKARAVLELAVNQATTLIDEPSTITLETIPRSRLKWLTYEQLKQSSAYLNAKIALARCLWAQDLQIEAIEHVWDVIQLDGRDDRGLRYPLACWLFEINDEVQFKRLTKMCLRQNSRLGNDNETFFLYLAALFKYKKATISTKPRLPANWKRTLASLFEANPFIAAYLIGRLPLPETPPASFYANQRLEGQYYAHHCLHLWKSVPGALENLTIVFDKWLEEFCADDNFKTVLQLETPSRPTK